MFMHVLYEIFRHVSIHYGLLWVVIVLMLGFIVGINYFILLIYAGKYLILYIWRGIYIILLGGTGFDRFKMNRLLANFD